MKKNIELALGALDRAYDYLWVVTYRRRGDLQYALHDLVHKLSCAKTASQELCKAARTRIEIDDALWMSSTVTAALQYASHNYMHWINDMHRIARLNSATVQPQTLLEMLCNEEAIDAILYSDDLGQIAIVALLIQVQPHTPTLRRFVHHVLNTATAYTHFTDILRILLLSPVFQASANFHDDEGNTALMLAVHNNCVEQVAMLLTCPRISAYAHAVHTIHGKNALMMAAKQGSAPIVAALLKCSAVEADASNCEASGTTALMMAAGAGNAATVAALLSCPRVAASASIVNHDGLTALMLAARYGKRENVQVLLTCSVVVLTANVANVHGDTALTIASKHGHTEIVNVLSATPNSLYSCSCVLQ
jgi:ankyrin repeat protein